MDAMAERYAKRGVKSIFLYTREAHPGEKRGHHESMEQKIEYAAELVERFGVRRPVYVDDLVGTADRAYGPLPNMSIVIKRRGAVAYRASWTDPATIDLAVQQLFDERARIRDRKRSMSYFVEWEPAMDGDSEAFLSALRSGGGERAADEFVEAIAQTGGEGPAAPLRRILTKLRA